MTKLKDVRVTCELHGEDMEACKQHSGQFACEPIMEVIDGEGRMSIEQRVEAWHNGDGEGLELHEYLGMSWEEYSQQFLPVPQGLLEEIKEIQTKEAENKKREVAKAQPVDITPEQAFAIAFERYKNALKEISEK